MEAGNECLVLITLDADLRGRREVGSKRRQTSGKPAGVKLAEDVKVERCCVEATIRTRRSPGYREFIRSTYEDAHAQITRPPVTGRYGKKACIIGRLVPNVHVFEADVLTPIELADGFTLWGVHASRRTQATF